MCVTTQICSSYVCNVLHSMTFLSARLYIELHNVFHKCMLKLTCIASVVCMLTLSKQYISHARKYHRFALYYVVLTVLKPLTQLWPIMIC